MHDYQVRIKQIEAKFLEDMDDLNQERMRLLSQKMADMQRHGLSIEKFQEIGRLADQRLNVLNEEMRLKTVGVSVEKNSAFDLYLSRKTGVLGKYAALIDGAKRGARDRMDAKWADIEKIKKDLRLTVEAEEKKMLDEIRHAEDMLGQGSDTEDRNVQVAMSKADSAYQAALAHQPEVQASHAHLMEAERQYRQASMHRYQARLLAKKNEIDDARKHAALGADKERASIVGVRHAEARVEELKRSIARDEQVVKKYHDAAELHDQKATTLADTPIEHIVKEQVSHEWRVKAEHTQEAVEAAKEATRHAQIALAKAAAQTPVVIP